MSCPAESANVSAAICLGGHRRRTGQPAGTGNVRRPDREIVIFDKAYVNFSHLADLGSREVFWGKRAKDNLQGRVVQKLQAGPAGNILRDDLVALTGPTARLRQGFIRSNCARHRPGRGGRRTPGNDFPDQQRDLERADHRRPVSLPLVP